jgi:hypothetical protein
MYLLISFLISMQLLKNETKIDDESIYIFDYIGIVDKEVFASTSRRQLDYCVLP